MNINKQIYNNYKDEIKISIREIFIDSQVQNVT